MDNQNSNTIKNFKAGWHLHLGEVYYVPRKPLTFSRLCNLRTLEVAGFPLWVLIYAEYVTRQWILRKLRGINAQ
jgi:hypothetical protein